jgi:sulfur-carrier protein
MPVTVHLSGHLKPYSDGQVEIPVSGEHSTINDVLESLWEVHPALHDRVLTETGEIRQHVNIFAGGRDVKKASGLATQLETSDIHIFNAVSGG